MDRVELLSPAGDFETALAAFEAGADAIYCGLRDFSARAFASNFSFEELKRIVAYARARGRKVYVTFNTVVDEDAIETAVEALSRLDSIGPDALIVQDLGVARLCRRHFPSLAIHASTQLVAHNLEGVLAMKDVGFTRVVLARELSLAEIASISKRCGGMELECFVHGALCYSVSGLCLFSAMEKDRSGNRGKCAYCCRMEMPGDGERGMGNGERGNVRHPYSMKDLRLGEDARKLADAGVASLKIEGRMKSRIYVASVTRYYRQLLDGGAHGPNAVTLADLETVFSRRTTKLYFDGPAEDVVDPTSLGHLGAPIGVVKRITKDRDGRSWIRFHTSRALERHDGLQFAAPNGGKPVGFGIDEMRKSISRSNVFEVAAGTDVEILLPEGSEDGFAAAVKGGATVYCSMSNAVKRMFPAPAFRPSDVPGPCRMDVEVTISASEVRARATAAGAEVTRSIRGTFESAKNPAKTADAVEKAFLKLGGTDYSLGEAEVSDPDGLFVPMSVLNDLRRDAVEELDGAREKARREKASAALDDFASPCAAPAAPRRTIRLRAYQALPQGEWDEVVVADATTFADSPLRATLPKELVRVATPVYTPEPDFNKLRVAVKRLVREGYLKWEASDLATLRMLKAVGVEDISADWTLYAFNSRALEELASLGVRRFVASPENTSANLQYLAESGYDVEFLSQQSTPLFISLSTPASLHVEGLSIFRLGGLWVTTRPVPRTFTPPRGASVRVDLGWSPEQC